MRIKNILILFICLAGCKEKDGLPSGILKPDKMRVVFWNIIQAESFTSKFIVKDSLKNAGAENAKLQQQIFAVNKITKEDFYKSYNYYTTHVELMRALLDSITANAERDKYTILYSKPAQIIPARFSFTPPLPPAPFSVIPMPIPTLETGNVNTINQSISPALQDSVIKNGLLKQAPKKVPAL